MRIPVQSQPVGNQLSTTGSVNPSGFACTACKLACEALAPVPKQACLLACNATVC